MCCRALSVYELEKPAGRWCDHCEVGKGCKIYAERPESCRRFSCMWLLNDWMPDSLRPDRCKVIFESTVDSRTVAAIVDPGRPGAYKRPDVDLAISIFLRDGKSILVVSRPGAVEGVFCADGMSPDDVVNDVATLVSSQTDEIARATGETIGQVQTRRERIARAGERA